MTETLQLTTPDGRSLDVWRAGPADTPGTLVVDTFPGILDELLALPA